VRVVEHPGSASAVTGDTVLPGRVSGSPVRPVQPARPVTKPPAGQPAPIKKPGAAQPAPAAAAPAHAAPPAVAPGRAHAAVAASREPQPSLPAPLWYWVLLVPMGILALGAAALRMRARRLKR
jgi:hypothetical protein